MSAGTAISDPRRRLPDPYWSEPRHIHPWHLRALVTLAVHQASGTVTVGQLVEVAEAQGFVLRGRPGKSVSDALRTPVNRGWVRRVGRGRYAPGRLPRTTAGRHRASVDDALRSMAERVRAATRPDSG